MVIEVMWGIHDGNWGYVRVICKGYIGTTFRKASFIELNSWTLLNTICILSK